MKFQLRAVLYIGLVLTVFSSCSKHAPKQTNFIPNNASFIVSINMKEIKDKLVKSQASLENILNNFSKGNDSVLTKGKEEWERLKNSGLDLDESFYMWGVQKKQAGNQDSISAKALTAVVGGLKDQQKFEAYLKSKSPTIEIQKEKDYSYAVIKGEQIVAWGKDVVIAMNYQQMNYNAMEFDSITGTFNRQMPPVGNLSAQLKSDMSLYFNQKESASMAEVSEYQELLKEKADVALWANPSETIENLPMMLPKLKALSEKSYTGATLKFEDGKMVVNSKSYGSKALNDLLKKYSGPKTNLKLVEQFPSANINGFMVFAFDPLLFEGLVKYMEVGALADNYVTKFMDTPFTLHDVLSAFKGDIAVTLADLQLPKGDTVNGQPPMGMMGPKGKLIFVATVADKAKMNKMMDRLVSMDMLDKSDGMFRPKGVPESFGLTATITDDMLIVASDNDVLKGYMAKGKATLKSGVLDGFEGKAAVGYLDLVSVLQAVSSTGANQQMGGQVMPLAQATFKDVRAYANNFNDNHIESHFELRFVNEKENSLTTLLNFASKVSDVTTQKQPTLVVE